jgi:hypothetical protein
LLGRVVTMPLRPCLDCGRLSPQSRCPRHRRTTTQRGLGYTHQRQAAAQIAAVPWCEDCGHTGSPDNPLTGEHGTARVHGGTQVDRTLCRRCNSARGSKIRRHAE